MKTEHLISEDGQHRVAIDGLRVWIFRDGDQWVAHGIDINYAVAADSVAEAQKLFGFGLCVTLIENIKRFGSIQRFISQRAPPDIEERWLSELERHGLVDEFVDLRVPSNELTRPAREYGIPSRLHYYHQPAHA